jgi:hypothetical protein
MSDEAELYFDENALWLRAVRDYIIPISVWLVMMRFLCGQVICPFFTSGMFANMRRDPKVDGSCCGGGRCDPDADEKEQENAAPTAAIESKPKAD